MGSSTDRLPATICYGVPVNRSDCGDRTRLCAPWNLVAVIGLFPARLGSKIRPLDLFVIQKLNGGTLGGDTA
jgi:hypothetical protein